jgi:hypothetical protein
MGGSTAFELTAIFCAAALAESRNMRAPASAARCAGKSGVVLRKTFPRDLLK